MSDESIRAVVVTAHGGSDVLRVQQRPAPHTAPGRLTVRLVAAGVNFIDVYLRQGVYPTTPPYVLACEGAGVVTMVGDGVTGFAVGDRVAWSAAAGSAAELVDVPAAAAVPVPDGVDLEVAAAAMLQGMTAHYLVASTYPVQPGDAVLVHAAAGGVGQLLVQLCAARGARVIATVSTPAKAEKVRALGATEVIGYTATDDLAAAVRAANGGGGVNVVYDGVGRATFEASLTSLARRGTLVLFGASSGQVPPFDLQRLNAAGSLFVTRPTLADHTTTRDELLWRSGEVLNSLADGSLRLEIGGRYTFADAARAYDDLEGRRTTGKLLLLPG